MVVLWWQEVVIMKDRSTGKSRGFGFVTFYRAADAACAANQEHVVDGRRCEVSLSLLRPQPCRFMPPPKGC